MKKFAVIPIAALLVSFSMSSFAATSPTEEKVVCNLASKNCVSRVNTLKSRIEKLNREVKKGNRKYSPEELKKLEMKLQEAQDQLDKVESTAK